MINNNTDNKIKQWLLTIIMLCLFTLPTQAAVPDDLDYQGYLTDSTGSPINSTVSVTFSLYNIELSGIALWSDTQSVDVSNGLFTVKLGGAGSPFPLGLFDAPLWLSLNVAGDGEMSPRITISSAAFAHKADDALTLDGISVGTLDQSAHVADSSNPHNVTAAQTGAADAASLSFHISNIANPHAVTAAQTGAASSTELTTHTGDVSAHHSRYNNVEAVIAMGATTDSNPLNHNKYSNSNAVAAIKAADGAGSTLDADLLDGLQANEIIDAAQDEVRTPISSLPFTISVSGSYYLTANLNGAGLGGIDINVSNVTLDLMGFTLDGGGSTDSGIYFYGPINVTIKNGTVTGFGAGGIYGPSSNYSRVLNVTALSNGSVGNSYGILLTGNNNRVERCIAADNGSYGIYTGYGSTVTDNLAYNNQGGGVSAGNGSTITGNTVYNNQGTYGLRGGPGSTITGNTAYSNQSTYAIYGIYGSTIIGNTAYSNQGVSGIYGSDGSTLISNTAYNNLNWGIYTTGANSIKDNTLHNNNTSATAEQGGLRVGVDSRVVGNTLDSNSQNNIYVNSSDNVIKDNHVTDSTNGIFFKIGGNYYRDNTASGNTTNFNMNGYTQIDGGGNAGF